MPIWLDTRAQIDAAMRRERLANRSKRKGEEIMDKYDEMAEDVARSINPEDWMESDRNAIAAALRESAADAYGQVSITMGDGNAVRRWAEATEASLRAFNREGGESSPA